METVTKPKTKVTAPAQTPEEVEAAEAEQVVPISKAGLLAQRRYHRNKAKIKELQSQCAEDQKLLEDEAEEKNAKVLTYKGVPAVAIVDTTSTENDYKGLWKKYPQIQAAFVSEFQTKTPSTRFDAKKPV